MFKYFVSSICTLFFCYQAQALSLNAIKDRKNCALMAVAEKMNMKNFDQSEVPKVVFSAESTLLEFQNEIEDFWKMRPDVFLNVYNAKTNKIFLATDEDRYKLPRTQLDSLAHEYTHFFQFLKSGKSLESMSTDDEYNENQAVEVQNWFRETNPCQIK